MNVVGGKAGGESLPIVLENLLVLLARLGMAGVFWRSGQTKVDGWQVTDSAVYLFAEEYRLPLLPPDVAAWLAAGAEHLFPVLLVLGLGSRFAALGLAGMTLVIQIFVYPGLWPDHLTWLAALGVIMLKGGGLLSADALIAWLRTQRRRPQF